jgi:hypothetical protein
MGSSCAPNIFGLPDCGIGHPFQLLTLVIVAIAVLIVIKLLVWQFCPEQKKQQKPAKEGWKRN